MKTKPILTALATTSLIVGGQALAQGRGGGQGHGSAGMGARAHGGIGLGQERIRVDNRIDARVDHRRVQTRTEARANSRGPERASDRGRARANENSVLNTGTRFEARSNARSNRRANSHGPAHVNDRALERANENSVLVTGRTSTDLSLLRTGLTVRNSAGTTLGTIARINRTRDGRIVNVLVRDEDGDTRTIPVAPNSLSISGDVVTTTSIGGR